jgi:hypothetical protein
MIKYFVYILGDMTYTSLKWDNRTVGRKLSSTNDIIKIL